MDNIVFFSLHTRALSCRTIGGKIFQTGKWSFRATSAMCSSEYLISKHEYALKFDLFMGSEKDIVNLFPFKILRSFLEIFRAICMLFEGGVHGCSMCIH